jgi:sigma-B regulation protein RsbU (phosphoserine phosphatase)
VMAAAGIHAAAETTPDETLAALMDSLSAELAKTEMHFSVFYGVLDPHSGRLSYANAGHPHAFRVPQTGPPERLEATAPPLGLAAIGSIQRRQLAWTPKSDLLVLWTDGFVDACNDEGEPYGEERLLDCIAMKRSEPVESILRSALADADAFGVKPVDDRTLLVLRI